MEADEITQLQWWTSNSPSTYDCTYSQAESWLRGNSQPAVAKSTTPNPERVAGWCTEIVICCTPRSASSAYTAVPQLVYDLVGAFGLDPDAVIAPHADTVEFGLHPELNAPTRVASPAYDFPAFSIADNTAFICWRWDPENRTTAGLTWFGNGEGDRQISFILEQLRKHPSLEPHPLFIAMLGLQAETLEMRGWINGQASRLTRTQLQTGYHSYAESKSSLDLDQLDLTTVSKDVCGLAVSVTTSALCMQQLSSLGTYLAERVQVIACELDSDQGAQARSDYDRAARLALETTNPVHIPAVTAARIKADSLHREAEAWKHKADILVTTLLSLTTQRDQNISIQIAADSRTLAEQATRDSTSMKAIAAVTMCFLPGTFVASLFAVPMFDWEASTISGSVNKHFWLYWAVTLPLTLVVICVWLLWTHRAVLFSSRQHADGESGSLKDATWRRRLADGSQRRRTSQEGHSET